MVFGQIYYLKIKKKKVKKKGLLGSTFKGQKKTQVSQQPFLGSQTE